MKHTLSILALLSLPAALFAQPVETGFFGTDSLTLSVEYQDVDQTWYHGGDDYSYSAPKLMANLNLFENANGLGVDIQGGMKYWRNNNYRRDFHYNSTVLGIGAVVYDRIGRIAPFAGIEFGYNHWEFNYRNSSYADDSGDQTAFKPKIGVEILVAPGFYLKPKISYTIPCNGDDDNFFTYTLDALYWVSDDIGVEASIGYSNQDHIDYYMSEVGITFRL